MFAKDLKKFNLPEAEEAVLGFWRRNKIFEKTLEKTKKGKRFVFFEGPPTANGRPGIHHVIGRTFKDVIPRYKSMRGYRVDRRAGWDTHGLPVELEVEKSLGLKSKKDIEAYGIAKFNQKCRESVWKYKEEWEKLTERVGFWLDFKDSYITYETDYIETLWWIISQIWKKKLLYKGHKVVPWCTRCGTALSSHELAQGYKEVLDKSVYVKFKIKNKGLKAGGGEVKLGKPTYILAWTTTPWTLPGNVALAVGKNISYLLLEVEGEIFIFAKELADRLGMDGKIIGEVAGKDLAGLEYEPLFEIPKLKNDKSHKIYPADFVTTTDGTGVVHTAVMYGEDDYELGTKLGLPKYHTVDEQGRFTADVAELEGRYVKDDETEDEIFEHLKKKGYFLKTEVYEHEYPFCWRCDTPLLYYARESWFVGMAKLRPKLLAANKLINWVPGHFKDGRFGAWLEEVKDWNFSRERYWGTPIPVWHCKKCDRFEAVGGLEDLNKKAFPFKNSYWAARHGEAESNMLGVTDSGQGAYHLTDKGKRQIGETVKKLKKAKIDIIIASPVLRTKETATIEKEGLGVEDVIFDERLREIHLGVLAGSQSGEYKRNFPTYESRFEGAPEGGESLRDVRARVWDLFNDLEKKYQGKRILLISHEYTIWMMAQAAEGWTEKKAIKEKIRRGEDFINPGEFIQLDFKVLPRDESGEVNLHRPYVDEIKIRCPKCKGEMVRIKELCDVWFDSGSMPFAQWHYPFENRDKIEKGIAFPADYIAEAVDQTRGWFYTLLAVSVLLGYKNPYKNVICYGHILDKHGKKMSKSRGNVVSPWEMAEKYGMDAVRWHFFSGGSPGEPRNFDESEVLKTYRRFHMLLWNSFVFYRTYADSRAEFSGKFKNILDRWILERLDETSRLVAKRLDKLEIREAALALEDLVNDLSRWFIRRSRRRFQKPENTEDYTQGSAALKKVLVETSKLIAPFTPFFAEVLFEGLEGRGSVHLQTWPTAKKTIDGKILKLMEEARKLASLGLAARAEAGIKVRQPLRALKIKTRSLGKFDEGLLTVLREEVNVKNIIYDSKIKNEVELDTKITAELKEEGIIREISRAVQDLRQRAGLEPGDEAGLALDLPEELRGVVMRNESLLKKEVGARLVEYKRPSELKADLSTKVDNNEIWLGIWKV